MFKRDAWLWTGHTIPFVDSSERLHYLKSSGFWVGQQSRRAFQRRENIVGEIGPLRFILFYFLSVCMWECWQPSLHHRSIGSRWISLTSEQHSELCICLFIRSTFVSMFAGPHMCMHLGYCVKPSVVNPLICWTLQITAVICQLCQRGLEGTCTSLHIRARTYTQTHFFFFFNFTILIFFSLIKT